MAYPLMLLLAVACGPGEAEHWKDVGLAPPETVHETAWFALHLRGRAIGVEQQLVGRGAQGDEVVRRRWYRVRRRGSWWATDVWGGERGPPGSLHDRLERVPLSGRAVPDPVDLFELLSVPLPPQARNPRGRRRMEVDLRRRETRQSLRRDAPLWAEVPPGDPVVLQPEHPLAHAVADLSGRSQRQVHVAVLGRVSQRLRTASTPGDLDGATAWAEGAGDCSEHARAQVALLEAAGMKARVVLGLLVVDEPRPALVPHAWTEALVGDLWVPSDPVLGQRVADAARISLDDLGAGDDPLDIVLSELEVESLTLR